MPWTLIPERFSRNIKLVFIRTLISLANLGGEERIGLLEESISFKPASSFYVQSTKDAKRKLRCDVHLPQNVVNLPKPLPVHVNLHPSGFIFNTFGQ